ncbi:uncharacterized protein CBL_13618 [Carabus blaptoides fortunei]
MLNSFKQQIRSIGKREINIKNSEKEAQLPIFQYPLSKKDDRRLYVWGFADTGALGVGVKETNKRNQVIKTPCRLSFAEKYTVTDVACGFGFTIIAVKSNEKYKLYGSGVNTDSQIGYHVSNTGSSPETLLYPMPISIPFQNEKESTILQLDAGRAHVLVLTSEGLFTLGNNAYGQCGRKIIDDEKYSTSSVIHHIPHFNGEKIVGVQCGQDHSLLYTDKGRVYSCGWGADGQTGLGHYNIESQFTQVLGDIQEENITKLACTTDCVLALNDKGEIFGWGNSEYGQLKANSDVQQINRPINLNHCRNIGKIVDIASGGSFCMALNDEGCVYVWGYGILGKGPEVQQSFTPTLIPSILFGCNDFQPDTKVTTISCGIGHLGAVTNYGDLYMWGKNRSGCLGLGHKNDQYFPLKVALGASVEKLTCGLDHTVALCKPFV